MADLGFNEAYRTHEFVVQIDGIDSPGITKVTGLTDGDIDDIKQDDGGANITHKLSSGIIKFGDLTLERNMDGSPADAAFLNWFQTSFKINGSGLGSSPSIRKHGTVIKKQYGQQVMQFAFYGAWVKSSKFTDLDASTSALMKQTIVLSIDSMERL